MTGLDWIITGAALLLALFGWAQGFISAALALVGFAIGAWIGTRIGPSLVGRDSPWAPAFGLLGALLGGAILAAGFEGLGSRLRAMMRTLPGLTAVDGLLGALLTVCVGLGVIWLLGAVALQHGGDARREVQRSAILVEPQRDRAAVERPAQRDRQPRSVPAHRRAVGRRSRAHGARSPPIPTSSAARQQRGEDPRHRLRRRASRGRAGSPGRASW